MKTAIIILNWNGRKLMEKYLPSVLAHSCLPDTQVVVADNGSTDDSIDWLKANYSQCRLLCFDKNYGFAEGYNRAIAAVEAEYVLLLNDDVRVPEHWLEPLVTYMDAHPEVAACQPKILSEREPGRFEHAGAAGGFIDRLGYPFCRGRIQSLVEQDHGQYDSVTDIFWATGACLLIRRQEYQQAGGLDAAFFAHMEEIDLCWRLRSRGRRIVCLPQSQVWHWGGGTLSAENPRKTFLNFRNNLLMLYKNLPDKRLRCTMAQRALLDWVAALFFFLKGERKNAKAVFDARKAYRQMKHDYGDIRRQVQAAATTERIPEIYPGISIVDYFLKGRKTFSQLHF